MTDVLSRAAAGKWLLAAALLLLPLSAHAGGAFTLERSTSPLDYRVNQRLAITLTVTLNTQQQVNSIGVEEIVPEGWTFQGVTTGITPQVQPQVGTDGLLEFAWFPLPPLPTFSFTYELAIPPTSIGSKDVVGRAIAFIAEVETISQEALSTIARHGSGTPLDSDRNGNFVLSMSEILRVVQFFALGGYRCAPPQVQTEDGFFAGTQAGNMACEPLDIDNANNADYAISMGELLRLVQLYNAGTYYSCIEGGDGFCTGPPPA